MGDVQVVDCLLNNWIQQRLEPSKLGRSHILVLVLHTMVILEFQSLNPYSIPLQIIYKMVSNFILLPLLFLSGGISKYFSSSWTHSHNFFTSSGRDTLCGTVSWRYLMGLPSGSYLNKGLESVCAYKVIEIKHHRDENLSN